MIAIIAEKPSVGMDIARVVGADTRNDGYCSGNGYMVTWALGHLVSLAIPDTYGYTKTAEEDLPMLPDPFRLVSRQMRTDRGMVTDIAASKQLKVIESVFNRCDSIVVATDAGREGELIFRWIYDFLGCTKPFRRLWISSLTDEAIRKGLEELKDGSEYDSLYTAADSRAKADWLVGMNASRALAIVSGSSNNSIGRVQTPTLAMICSRYRENRSFVSTPYWQLHVTLNGGTSHRRFFHPATFDDRQKAEAAYRSLSPDSSATVTKVERRKSLQQPPLLYDLTALQKDCNVHLDLPAAKTLDIAQSLYEKKLITYPRTGSRYIPEDVFAEIPKLLAFIGALPEWKGKVQPKAVPTRRSVDGSKVTDHHALLVTGEKPLFLSKEDNTVYQMVAGRMIEAFSEKCVKDTATVTAECAGVEFTVKGSVIRQAGWRAVYGEEDKEETAIPGWREGDTLTLKGCSITEGKTKPKPLHTEATLLSAMETAGKDIEDDALRQALKDCGIGTPATRAAIIETLFKRGYMERCKKSLVPTEKGLALYSVVKTMRIADVAMTGEWEKNLARIERGELPADTFCKEIEAYTKEITSELLSCDKLFARRDSGCKCPKCGTGSMQFYGKVVRCDNADCGLPVFRLKANRTLSDDEIKELLTDGHTKPLKGFKSKQGKSFDAIVAFDGDYNTTFVFPERKTSRKFSGRKK